MSPRKLTLLAVAAPMIFSGGWQLPKAVAVEIGQNIAFTAVNQNPWNADPAFEMESHYKDLMLPFDVSLPTLHANPVSALAELIGIDLPFNADVAVGASASGSIGLDLGYYVSGGRLNIKYPARSSLEFETPTGAPNTVVAGRAMSIGSAFHPGINGVTRSFLDLAAVAGDGYAQQSVPGFTTESFSDPTFATTSPYASAWADVGFNIQAEAFIKAEAEFLGECVACARVNYVIKKSGSARIVEVDPSGIRVTGQEPVQFFNEDIGFGFGIGSINIGYPNVQVQSGALQPDASLHGSTVTRLMTLQGNLEKFIPVVGLLLSNNIEGFGYTLASFTGGPTLSVYQDLDFTPTPRRHLVFSEPVMLKADDGTFHPTNVVDFALGDTVDVKPITGSLAPLRVSPTYYLNNTFHNETGFTVGADFNLKLLEVQTPVGDFGPAFEHNFNFSDLARVPVYENTFEIPFGQITGNTIEFNKVSAAVGNLSVALGVAGSQLISVDPATQTFTYRLHMNGDQDGAPLDFFVDVTRQGVQSPRLDGTGNLDTFLMTADDVIVEPTDESGPINLGSVFGIAVADSSQFLEIPNPLILDDDGEPLFLSTLFDFPDGLVDVDSNPILSQGNYVEQIDVDETTIDVTDPILAADFDSDGDVDGGDFLAWQSGFGIGELAALTDGDANADEIVDADDQISQSFGSSIVANATAATAGVPEPSSILSLCVGALSLKESPFAQVPASRTIPLTIASWHSPLAATPQIALQSTPSHFRATR